MGRAGSLMTQRNWDFFLRGCLCSLQYRVLEIFCLVLRNSAELMVKFELLSTPLDSLH